MNEYEVRIILDTFYITLSLPPNIPVYKALC